LLCSDFFQVSFTFFCAVIEALIHNCKLWRKNAIHFFLLFIESLCYFFSFSVSEMKGYWCEFRVCRFASFIRFSDCNKIINISITYETILINTYRILIFENIGSCEDRTDCLYNLFLASSLFSYWQILVKLNIVLYIFSILIKYLYQKSVTEVEHFVVHSILNRIKYRTSFQNVSIICILTIQFPPLLVEE
jgi:hypothetical protein